MITGYWLVYKAHPLIDTFGIHQRYAADEQERAARDSETLKKRYPKYRIEVLPISPDGYPSAYWARISSLWSFVDEPL